MKIQKIIIAILVIMAGTLSLSAFENGKCGRRGKNPRRHYKMLVEKYDLTESQQEELKEIFQKNMTNRIEAEKDRKEALEFVIEKLNSDSVNLDNIISYLNGKLGDRNRMSRKISNFKEVYNILDDDQKSKAIKDFVSRLEEKVERMEKRMERRESKSSSFDL